MGWGGAAAQALFPLVGLKASGNVGLSLPGRADGLGESWVILGASPQTLGVRLGWAVVLWAAGLALPGARVGLSWQLSQGHTQLRSKAAELLMPLTKRAPSKAPWSAPTTTLALPWGCCSARGSPAAVWGHHCLSSCSQRKQGAPWALLELPWQADAPSSAPLTPPHPWPAAEGDDLRTAQRETDAGS